MNPLLRAWKRSVLLRVRFAKYPAKGSPPIDVKQASRELKQPLSNVKQLLMDRI